MTGNPYAAPTPREEPDAWKNQGLCAQVGGDGWFPEKGQVLAVTPRDAKRICADCPVAAQCLQYAIDHDERFGIWGGMSPREREALRPAPRHTATHGTNSMYRLGCRTDDDCPDKYTCAQAHRDYQRNWDHKRKANGMPRRTGGAA